MAIRQWSLFLISGSLSLLAGCGGGTTAHVENPPAPASSSVSIAFQPAPPSSLLFGGTTPLTAVVTNDPTNSGVDWTLNCQNPGSCGTLGSQHTASGQPTMYLPPAALSSNAQGVSISAFATADHTKNVSTPLTITAFASFLQAGTYILETTGISNAALPYQRVAAVVLHGDGTITGGEQTVNFSNPSTSLFSSVNDTITGGTYFIGPDGRGTLTLNTTDTSVGQSGIETFNLVALSSSQVFLTDASINNPNIPLSNENSIGTMDLQAPGTQAITGGYALVTRGSNGSVPVAFGGVLNIDGAQTISGIGSKFDEVIDGSATVTPSVVVSGSVSAPDPFGTIHISLNTDFGSPAGSPQLFTAYVIDASHLKLIETDGTTALTAGLAIGQGTLTGTYSTFSGAYTFGVFGSDLNQQAATLAAAANFTAGSGALTNGSIDETQSGLQVQITDGFSASYTLDPSGRVDTGSSFAFTSNGPGPELVFYLTGNGNPALVLDADTETSLSGGGVATGIAYPSAANATFSGDYGLSFTQNLIGTEGDATGQICVNGSSVTCPLPTSTLGAPDTLFGTVDETLSFSPQGPTSVTDGFQPSGSRLTGTLSDSVFNNSTLSVAYYLIDSDHGFFVETDGGTGEANPGYLTFGYFARRTPVCTGCP